MWRVRSIFECLESGVPGLNFFHPSRIELLAFGYFISPGHGVCPFGIRGARLGGRSAFARLGASLGFELAGGGIGRGLGLRRRHSPRPHQAADPKQQPPQPKRRLLGWRRCTRGTEKQKMIKSHAFKCSLAGAVISLETKRLGMPCPCQRNHLQTQRT